jgi:hypothetical protein
VGNVPTSPVADDTIKQNKITLTSLHNNIANSKNFSRDDSQQIQFSYPTVSNKKIVPLCDRSIILINSHTALILPVISKRLVFLNNIRYRVREAIVILTIYLGNPYLIGVHMTNS